MNKSVNFLSFLLLGLLLLLATPVFVAAQITAGNSSSGGDELKIPDEVRAFIEKNLKPIELKTGDLNGDGTKDFILILDQAKESAEIDYSDESLRSMLILIRGNDGNLSLAARNDVVVRCRSCGGAYGDPFEGVEISPSGFGISNMGGSRERWVESFDFKYSRRDKTWQIVRVVQTTYDTFNPNKARTRTFTPPKSFGKISFSEFDPDNFMKKGAR